jgi:hypothetical protein
VRKIFAHILYVGTSEFFDNMARASQFLAENESTGVLDALSQVRSTFCMLTLIKNQTCHRLCL